jgi:hypothetical protein
MVLRKKNVPLWNDEVSHKKSFGRDRGHSSAYGRAVSLLPRGEAEMGEMTVSLDMPPDGRSTRGSLCCYDEACGWHTLDECRNGRIAILRWGGSNKRKWQSMICIYSPATSSVRLNQGR